jgi:hypothetical protein
MFHWRNFVQIVCKGKTFCFNFFHTFHLQPIWLTIRYSKRILSVSQAAPAANWYYDAVLCLHCHGQAFSSVTVSQMQQQNIQADLKLQQQQCEKLKNWDCCIHLQDCTVSKHKRMQNGHSLKQGNNAKRPGCCHRILKQYFIITSRKTISWGIVPEWTNICLRGILHVTAGCLVCLCLPAATQRHITLTDQHFKLKAQHTTASEAQWHFCMVCKQKRQVKNVKD